MIGLPDEVGEEGVVIEEVELGLGEDAVP